jgi:hypothetical protein
MKAGNLVKITRASIGIPIGTIGLVVKKVTITQDTLSAEGGFELKPLELFVVQMCGHTHTRRWLARDLEVLS